MPLAPPQLVDRYKLIRYCGELGYKTFAEVGVCKGKFSKWVLEALPNATVYRIDGWRPLDGQFMRDTCCFAMESLVRFPDRSRVIIAPSPQIADLFAHGSLDVCY